MHPTASECTDAHLNLSLCSDGRSQRQRIGHPINPETLTIIPRTQRIPESARTEPNSVEFIKELREKLEDLQRKQLINRQMQHQFNIPDPSDNSSRPSKHQINPSQFVHDLKTKLQLEDDNDQSILDKHVSRVWDDLTPHRSPGTVSPCPPVPNRRRTHDPPLSGIDGNSVGSHIFQHFDKFSRFPAGQSMRHSKSMPDHASSSKRLTHKWASMNTDSGISLFSADTLRSRDSK